MKPKDATLCPLSSAFRLHRFIIALIGRSGTEAALYPDLLPAHECGAAAGRGCLLSRGGGRSGYQTRGPYLPPRAARGSSERARPPLSASPDTHKAAAIHQPAFIVNAPQTSQHLIVSTVGNSLQKTRRLIAGKGAYR